MPCEVSEKTPEMSACEAMTEAAVDDVVRQVVKIGHLLFLAAIAVNRVDLVAQFLHGLAQAALELGGKADLQSRGGAHAAGVSKLAIPSVKGV